MVIFISVQSRICPNAVDLGCLYLLEKLKKSMWIKRTYFFFNLYSHQESCSHTTLCSLNMRMLEKICVTYYQPVINHYYQFYEYRLIQAFKAYLPQLRDELFVTFQIMAIHISKGNRNTIYWTEKWEKCFKIPLIIIFDQAVLSAWRILIW